jgi:hypothetical protein
VRREFLSSGVGPEHDRFGQDSLTPASTRFSMTPPHEKHHEFGKGNGNFSGHAPGSSERSRRISKIDIVLSYRTPRVFAKKSTV